MKKSREGNGGRKRRLVLILFLSGVGLLIAPLIYERLSPQSEVAEPERLSIPPLDLGFVQLDPYETAALPLAARFESPLGTEEGGFAYNAQPFGRNRHLGADLNGIGGWNSDLGDPVYASGRGRVVLARDAGGGWGNMVLLAHRVRGRLSGEGTIPNEDEVILTVYAHLDRIDAIPGEVVERGEVVGSVGTANRAYLAHLHFEVRTGGSIDPGVGYDLKTLDRLNPSEFLSQFGRHQASARFPAPALTETKVEPQLKFAPSTSED